MNLIECAGGLVVNPTLGQIIVITNQIGKQTFPKGTCQDGESHEQTAKREIEEETGLSDFEITRRLGVIQRLGYTATKADAPSVIKRITMFHCITDQVDMHPVADDVFEARWRQPLDLVRTLTWPEELAFFEQYRATIGL
jgi:8-oxo-dGTP pyrophosphatase MutT (NUDIX family)